MICEHSLSFERLCMEFRRIHGTNQLLLEGDASRAGETIMED